MRIELRIKKTLGAFRLDIDQALDGGVIGVFGPSGSGKTTLLNCLAGFARPGEGRIVMGGRELFCSRGRVNLAAEHRRAVMVFQEGILFPHLSVKGNIFYAAKSVDKKFTSEVLSALELHRLLDRLPAKLSGGERQRVSLARALLARPEVILLDEPVTALDVPAHRQILAYLKEVHRQFHTPMIYGAHSVSELLLLADTVVVMDQGKVKSMGRPLETLLPVQSSGAGEIENIFELSVVEMRPRMGMAVVDFSGHLLKVAYSSGAIHPRLRVGIRAADIILSLSAPAGLSARNVIPAVVRQIYASSESCIVEAGVNRLSCLVELTPESELKMGLKPGVPVYLIIEASSSVVFNS